MLMELLTEKYPGMRLWLMQRITAVIMAVYIPLAIVYFMIKMPINSQAVWVAFNSPWWWRVFTWLFFFSICLHAWIGVKDVFEDYVFNQKLRDFLQTLVELMLFAYLVWISVILWRL